MKLEIHNIDGKKTSKKVTLPEDIFGIEPNDHAIYLAVKQYLANQRQGTHKTLERSEISGSTKKLHKQKGTGGSRKGSGKNTLFRGGPRTFGPRPRDYGFKLNKKVKELAKYSALSYKAKDNNIVVVEDFKMNEPKTKEFLNILKNLGVADKKVLFVINETDKNFELASRNLQKINTCDSSLLNTYDVMNADSLILSEGALKAIENSAKVEEKELVEA